MTETIIAPATPEDIKIYNDGPLTTIFTPSIACDSTNAVAINYSGVSYSIWMQPSCYPRTTIQTGASYYSPGICPSGWSPVTSISLDEPAVSTGFKISHAVSFWLCCPPYYSGFGAYIVTWASTWFLTTYCTSTVLPGHVMTSVWVTVPSDLTSIRATTTMHVLGKGIQIMWESTDTAVEDWWSTARAAISITTTSTPTSLLTFPTATITPAITTPPTTAHPTTTHPTTTPPATIPPSSLSPSDKIALSIGIIGVMATLLGAFFGWKALRNRRGRRYNEQR